MTGTPQGLSPLHRSRGCARAALGILVCWMALALVGPAPALGAGPRGKAAGVVPGEILVRYRRAPQPAPAAPGVKRLGTPRPSSLEQLDQRFGLRQRRELLRPGGRFSAVAQASSLQSKSGQDAGAIPLYLLQLHPATNLDEAVKAYQADPDVLWAEPNQRGTLAAVPSDPLYPQTAANLALIGMEAAWDVQPGATAAVKVAVIDSGVDALHPDLAGALDLANSYNFVDGNTRVFDDLGHGTRVAGIIGAVAGNAEGIAGVAYGCRLLSLDVTDPSGTITTARVVAALGWAVDRGAGVINMSLRFDAPSQALEQACAAAEAAGAVLVAAAGNENQGDTAVWPASYETVLSVGALMADGLRRAPWSNFNGAGPKLADLVAPGTAVFTTIPAGQYNGNYGSGTSFAAPLAAGVAALLQARNPGQSAGAIRQHLKATCRPVTAAFLPAGGAGAGRLDAAAALGTPMLPELSVASVTVDDALAYSALNNANGTFNSGETVRLVVSLKNTGADATSVRAILATTNTLATLGDTTASWGAIRHGETVAAADAFTSITMAPLAPAQQLDLFLLSTVHYATDSQTLIQGYEFKVPVENEISISGVKFNQTFASATTWHVTGNLILRGNTIFQPGTTIKSDPGVVIQASTGCNLTALGTADAKIRFTSAQPNGYLGSPAGTGVGLSDPSNVGPKNVPVNVGAYQQVRYVSISTGADITSGGTQASPWRTIQYAIDQIADASTSKRYALLVAAGTYTGNGDNVAIMKEWVDLYGGFEASGWTRNIFGHASTLDGQNVRRGVYGANNARLDGFTIRRGYSAELDSGGGGGVLCRNSSPAISNNTISDNSVNNGGGIHCQNSSAVILNNTISGNAADYSAGGILCYDSSPVISNNTISDNSADFRGGGICCTGNSSSPTISNNTISDNVTGGSGGGIVCVYNASPTISHNIISGSTGGGIGCDSSSPTISYNIISGNIMPPGTDFGGNGGGIGCSNSSPAISHNTISGNSAPSGGGIQCYSSSAVISNNTISGNTATVRGGGIECSVNSSPIISNNTISDNSAISGGGIVCVYNASPTISNNTISGNSAPDGGGINSWSSSPSILNTIIYGNTGSGNIISSGAGTPILRFCDVEGGWSGAGGNNIDAPPQFARSFGGVVLEMQYQAEVDQTILTDSNASLPSGSLVGRFVRVGSYYYPVASNTATVIVVTGDATRGGTVSAPQTWQVRDYHLQVDSACRGQGVGPADVTYGAGVPLLDMDEEARTGLTCDIGADEYHAATSPQSNIWGRLQVAPGATSAQFQHVVVENGVGLLNEIANASFSDCLFQRNTDYGLRSIAGTSTITSTTAMFNLGVGIDAPLRPLMGCSALYQGGKGLIGAALDHCRAYGNGADGLTGTGATDCTSEFNAGDGAVLGGSALRVTARDNRGRGIVTTGGDVTDCESRNNDLVGISIGGGGTASGSIAGGNRGGGVATSGSTIDNCTVEGNTGVGITGSGSSVATQCRIIGNTLAAVSGLNRIQDCAIAENGSGINGTGTITGSYIAANAGAGVTGGAVSNTSVLGNAGHGVSSPGSLSNSWIVGNGGWGVLSVGGAGAVTASSILNNVLGGVKDILTLSGSNIYGNSPFDALDVVATGSEDRIFRNNYWGPASTALLNAGNPYDNMPFLRDVLDGSGNHLIDVWPYASARLASAPDDSAPAFLLDVAPNLANAVDIGPTTFTLTFSKAMDTSVQPSVTFAMAAPYTAHVVAPYPGWISPTTWRGRFAIQLDTGAGRNTIRLSGARAADGFLIPDDTAHVFTITVGHGAANNGVASSLGGTRVSVDWSTNGEPDTTSGYNILRSTSGLPGTYERINDEVITGSEYTDTETEPDTTYYYVVDQVDSDNNTYEWTPPFDVETEPAPDVAPTITRQPAPLTLDPGATANFSITATGTAPLAYQWRKGGADLGNDGRIRGADTDTLQLDAATMADAGRYDCVVTNTIGTAVSDAARLTVNPTLTVASAHGAPTPAAGAHVYTTGTLVGASVAGSPELDGPGTTRWVQTGWSGTGSVPAGGGGASTSFNLTLDSALTWNWAAQYRLAVAANPPGGGAVVFDGTATPAGGTWHDSGAAAAIRAVPGPGYVFGSWSGDAGGASNPLGISMTGPRSITANFIQLPAISAQPAPQTVDPGATAGFSVSATGTAPLNYRWRKGGVNLNDGGRVGGAWTRALTLTGALMADAGFYNCVVSNAGGTTTSLAARLIVQPTLTVTSAHGAPTPAAGAHVYTTGTLVDASVAGSPVLDGPGTTRWLAAGWTGTGSAPASGATTQTQFNIVLDSALTWNWRTQHKLLATASPAGGGQIVLSGTATAAQGTWHDAGTTATVRAIPAAGWVFGGWAGDAFGASTTSALSMILPRSVMAGFIQKPVIGLQPAAQTVNPGTTVTLSLTATGTAPLTYQWRKNKAPLSDGGRIGGVRTASLTLGAATWSDAGWYSCVVGNSAGTTESRFARLVVNPTLSVVSGHGLPAPAAGVQVYTTGTLIHFQMSGSPELDPAGTTRWVCTGWTAPGLIPASGGGAGADLVLNRPVTFTWQWQKQYWLATASVPAGRGWVRLTDGQTAAAGWYDEGRNVDLYAVPAAGWGFYAWWEDLGGRTDRASLLLDRPRSVLAQFMDPHNGVADWRGYR